MEIRGVTLDQIYTALESANREHNTTLEPRSYARLGRAGTSHRLTLKLANARDPFHRRAQNVRFCRCRQRGFDCPHTPPRMGFVCWHGHREFMRALYALAPDAIIITGSIFKGGIRYNGSAHFEAVHDDTGDLNIGSQAHPLAWRDACDCDDGDDSQMRAYAALPRLVYDPTPVEDYGASEADGAACRAMANALAAIQRERAPRPEGVPA